MEVDLRKVGSVAALGETLTRLKHRSGRSLSQLSNATASVGGGGLSRSTLNGYFKGRHLPQQGVGHEFRLLMRELGVCDDAELDAWWATVERLRRGHCDGGRPDNPYPGLRPFDTADTGRFFGRSALTDRLVQQVSVSRASGIPVMVVGPSGIGKSSLLRAGLVSRLSAEGWAPVLMTPGKRPCATLAAQLGQRLELDTDVRQLVAHASSEGADLVQGLTDGEGRDRRCVLIVDQFEEVFSDEVTDDERGLFFAAVRAMTRTAVVVLGLRADFYGHALRHPDLAVALQKSQLVVGPMLESELREAITEPAHMAGFQVEAGLVELLLREMAPSTAPHQVAAHEPGAMPLLSHALQATFEAAVAADTDKILTVQGYRSTGGIHHAVADTAEAAYAALATRGQQLARQVFLRLVHVGEGTADTRRVVDRDELVGQRSDAEAEELDDILDTLVACRLLSAGDRNVQISHEALLVAWPRLRSWLDDDRAGRRLHRRLTHAAREWRNNGRSIDDLYQGRTLTATLAWVAETGQDDLNPLEREFLEASIDKRDAEQESARKRVRRRYQITSAVVVMIVLVAATTIYAWRTQQAADHAAQAALSRDIAAKATRLRSTAPALAAQLAAVAYRSAATVEARSALLDSAANPIPARRHGPTGSTKLVAATSSLTAMASENGTIALARTGEPTVAGPPLRLGSSAVAVALSDDATMLAAVGANGTTHLWDVRDASAPRELATLAGPRGTVTSVAFSPNNRMLAAGDADGTVRLWHLGQHGGSPSPPAMLSGPEAAVTSVAFAPDSQTLAVGSKDGTVHRFDLSDASRPRPLPRLTGPSGEVFSVAISPDGRTLAAGTAKDRAVYLWDIADPHQPRSAGKLTGPTSWVTFIDFSPDGERLIAGSSDSKLWQWSLATRQPLNTLPHPGVITTALYIDNHTVMTLAEDGIIRTWTTTGSVLDDFGDTVYGVDFKPGGRIMAVGPGREDNAIHLVDITNPNAPTPIGVPLTTDASDSELSGPLVISPDGTLLAAGTGDGQVYL